jgi:hypothetical protein
LPHGRGSEIPFAMHSYRPFGSLILVTVLVAAPIALPKTSSPGSWPTVGSSQQDSAGPTAPRGKKLVMKDGTFQIASSYQIDGDRVRYFSVERSEWEEIPSSLVDWPATRQAEADAAKTNAALTNKLKASEAVAEKASVSVDASFEVAPGVFLPPGDGFFILEGQTIFPLKQSPASAKLSKGHLVEQIAVPVPVVGSRTSVDLPGQHATFRTVSPTPEFYLRTSDLGEPQIELLAARVQRDKRHVENIDTFFGQQNHKGKTISIQEWKVADGLYRFTLGQPLTPGEYALAQFSPREGINLLLWDFGVDAPPKHSAKKK